MIPLCIQRWWSLKPFFDKGVGHGRGTTRDERHFEFRSDYWEFRTAGHSHQGALLLARLYLRFRYHRRQYLEEISELHQEVRALLDRLKEVD